MDFPKTINPNNDKLVALMVTKEGFPIANEVFAGDTFEGHTIVPVVKSFINKK